LAVALRLAVRLTLLNERNKSGQRIKPVFQVNNIVISPRGKGFAVISAIPGDAVSNGSKHSLPPSGKYLYRTIYISIQEFDIPGVVYPVSVRRKRVWNYYRLFCRQN